MSRAIEPVVVVRRATLAEIMALRHAELRPGRPLDAARFDGDGDPTTRHFAAFLQNDPDAVGCASAMARPWEGESAFQLRGMATRAALVRRGIGAALLRFLEPAICAEAGVRLLWCNARRAAVPFYRRLGWEVVSDEFDIPTVGPHHTMIHRHA